MCDLPSGAEFYCNKIAVDCDLLITEGFIEPHFFAGFSGGRKSILPGIANAATVNENHSYKQIADIHSTTGVLEGNPLHKDMVVAARAVNVQFIMESCHGAGTALRIGPDLHPEPVHSLI